MQTTMPMLWLLLFPLASLLRSATSGGGNTSCAQATCGSLTIRFPFSLAGVQPLYCGYPVFDLTCDAGRGNAYLSKTFRERLFRVADISYASNTMVATIAGNGGCPVPDFNVSGSLALFPFTISAANKRLVFFYDCHVPPEHRLPLLPPLCGNRTVGAYISGHWGKENTLPLGVPANCSTVSVPVRGRMEPASLLYYELLMADGFLLDLPLPLGDCDACRRVRGECRLDRLSFMCVCPDGKLCPSFAQSNSTTQQDRGNFRLKIIGTGLAAALLCLVVLGIVRIIQNVQRKRKRSASLDGLIIDGGSPLASPKKEFTLAGSLLTHIFTYEELDEATNDFSDTRVLGSGGFGTVYKGILRDGSVVAVKRLYKNSYKSVEQFENEVDILSRLRHPNLVAFYGCTSSSQGSCCRDLLLAYEFVPNGTLADHLHCGGEAPLLAWPTRLSRGLLQYPQVNRGHRSQFPNDLFLISKLEDKQMSTSIVAIYEENTTSTLYDSTRTQDIRDN